MIKFYTHDVKILKDEESCSVRRGTSHVLLLRSFLLISPRHDLSYSALHRHSNLTVRLLSRVQGEIPLIATHLRLLFLMPPVNETAVF